MKIMIKKLEHEKLETLIGGVTNRDCFLAGAGTVYTFLFSTGSASNVDFWANLGIAYICTL